MGRFREKLVSFMYGRYGNDSLNTFMLVLYLILALASVFVRSFIPGIILRVVMIALIVLVFLRMLSRKTYSRQKENALFMKVWKPLKNELILTKNRLRDIKGFRYRKCRHCHAALRLPRRRGKHTVKCPKCGERFNVRVLF